MKTKILIGLGIAILAITVILLTWSFYQNLEKIENSWEVEFVYDAAELKNKITTCWRDANQINDISTIYNFGSSVQTMQNCNYMIKNKTYASILKEEITYNQSLSGVNCFADEMAWVNGNDAVLKTSASPFGTEIQWLFEKPSNTTIMLVDELSRLKCSDLSTAWKSVWKEEVPEEFRKVWFKELISLPSEIPIELNVSVLACNGTHLLIKNVGDKIANNNADLKLVVEETPTSGRLEDAGAVLIHGLNILPGVTKWIQVSDELSMGEKYTILDDDYPKIDFICSNETTEVEKQESFIDKAANKTIFVEGVDLPLNESEACIVANAVCGRFPTCDSVTKESYGWSVRHNCENVPEEYPPCGDVAFINISSREVECTAIA